MFALHSVALAMQLAVFDPTNYAENVLHVTKAVEQIRLTQSTIDNQLRALRKLGHAEWRDISAVVAAATTAQVPGSDVGRRFSSLFPGAVPTRNFPSDDRARSRSTLAALAGVLDAVRATSSTVAPGAAQLDRFKPQVARALGHEESLELANTVHVYTAQELTLLRQAIAAQTSAEAVYYAHQVNAAAESDENARALWVSMAGSANAVHRPLISYAAPH
jgi:P-type conjugative transfer protein TrbJ